MLLKVRSMVGSDLQISFEKGLKVLVNKSLMGVCIF